MVKPKLWIDAPTGFSAEQFAAALVGLGLPESQFLQVMRATGSLFGVFDAHLHVQFLSDDQIGYALHLTSLSEVKPLSPEEAAQHLDVALSQAGVKSPYADFARRALAMFRRAKPEIASPPMPNETISLPVIGRAHTPYRHKAPYQPRSENEADGLFYIQIAPQYVPALQSLATFRQIFVLSYLDQALSPELTICPPWKDTDERFGTFATRTPNRPSPIGLTRVALREIQGSRVFTGPLDLFDGTPILDIKPFILSIDGPNPQEDANDGWLDGSDHLKLHQMGVAHRHSVSAAGTDEPHRFIAVLTGIAWGLQYFQISPGALGCEQPFRFDPKLLPGIGAVLAGCDLPLQPIVDSVHQITVEGAAILAGLDVKLAVADHQRILERDGYGFDGTVGETQAALRLSLTAISKDQKTC